MSMTPAAWASAISKARSHIHSMTGYTVKDDQLVRHVINHCDTRSYGEVRRLALLGDMALRTAILDAWYPTGKDVRAGQISVVDIASNARLSHAGFANDMESILVSSLDDASRSKTIQERRMSNTFMATVVEALFGAVYLDSSKDVGAVDSALRRLRLDVGGPAPPGVKKWRTNPKYAGREFGVRVVGGEGSEKEGVEGKQEGGVV